MRTFFSLSLIALCGLLPNLAHAETRQQHNDRINTFLYRLRNAPSLTLETHVDYHQKRVPLLKGTAAQIPESSTCHKVAQQTSWEEELPPICSYVAGTKPRETTYHYSTTQRLQEVQTTDQEETSTITDGEGTTIIDSFKTNEPNIAFPPGVFPKKLATIAQNSPRYLTAQVFDTPYRFEWVRKDLNVYRRVAALPKTISALIPADSSSTPPLLGSWFRDDRDYPDRVWEGRYDWDIQSDFSIDGRFDLGLLFTDLTDLHGPYQIDHAQVKHMKNAAGKIYTTLTWKPRPAYRIELTKSLTKSCIKDSERTCSKKEIEEEVTAKLRTASPYIFQLTLDEGNFPITLVRTWHGITNAPVGCTENPSTKKLTCKNTMRSTEDEKMTISFRFNNPSPVTAPAIWTDRTPVATKD